MDEAGPVVGGPGLDLHPALGRIEGDGAVEAVRAGRLRAGGDGVAKRSRRDARMGRVLPLMDEVVFVDDLVTGKSVQFEKLAPGLGRNHR